MPSIRTRPESLPLGLLLAAVGGFLDAFTFAGYGGVFANTQTGNIVLMGITTLTMGNLRSLVEKTYRWRADHDATAGRQAAQLAAVIVALGVGAGVGAWCTHALSSRAAWVAAAGLIIALACIVVETITLSRRERGGRARREHQGFLRNDSTPAHLAARIPQANVRTTIAASPEERGKAYLERPYDRQAGAATLMGREGAHRAELTTVEREHRSGPAVGR